MRILVVWLGMGHARAEQTGQRRAAAGQSHEASTRQSNIRHSSCAFSLSYGL